MQVYVLIAQCIFQCLFNNETCIQRGRSADIEEWSPYHSIMRIEEHNMFLFPTPRNHFRYLLILRLQRQAFVRNQEGSFDFHSRV